MKISNELKTGLMVLITLALFAVMITKVVDFNLKSKGYHVRVCFDYAGGVLRNAPVRLAGVDVGKVSSVDIVYHDAGMQVQLDLLIRENAHICRDAKVYISTLGLMGEKYVEISPGQNCQEYLNEGEVLQGENPLQVEKIVDNANKTIAEMERLTANLNNLLQRNADSIDTTLKNFQLTSANLLELSANIKDHPWKLFIKQKKKKPRSKKKRVARKSQQKNQLW